MSETFDTAGAVAAGVGIILGAVGGTVPAARPSVLAIIASIGVIVACYAVAGQFGHVPTTE